MAGLKIFWCSHTPPHMFKSDKRACDGRLVKANDYLIN